MSITWVFVMNHDLLGGGSECHTNVFLLGLVSILGVLIRFFKYLEES